MVLASCASGIWILESVTTCPDEFSIVSLVAPRETITWPWALVATLNSPCDRPITCVNPVLLVHRKEYVLLAGRQHGRSRHRLLDSVERAARNRHIHRSRRASLCRPLSPTVDSACRSASRETPAAPGRMVPRTIMVDFWIMSFS